MHFQKTPYPKSITQTFSISINNFELEIVVVVASFGIDSKEALVVTIGTLIEVTISLLLVHLKLSFRRHWFGEDATKSKNI